MVWEKKITQIVMGRGLRLGDFVVGNMLQYSVGKWGEEVSIDYMLFGKGLDVIKMVVEDSGIWILGQIIISSGEK